MTAVRRRGSGPGTTRRSGPEDRHPNPDGSWSQLPWAPRPGRQDVFEPLEGAQVALGGGRLANPQDLSALDVGQLLEVPQGHDLAVDRLHRLQGLHEAELPLGADGRLAGTGVAAQELGG